MDLRSEPRFPTDEPVRVTVLGGTKFEANGRIVNVSGRGMRLRINARVPVGAAIRVDVDGSLLLGEVAYCQADGEFFAVGLQLEQALTISEELSRLMRRLMEESAGAAPDGTVASHPRMA